jgi:hypothetical protein
MQQLIMLILLIVIKNHLFKNKGKVIPVTWYRTCIPFWSFVRWLIAWLMFNTQRAVFQMFSGREQVQWYISNKLDRMREGMSPPDKQRFDCHFKGMKIWVGTNRNIPSSTNREQIKRK